MQVLQRKLRNCAKGYSSVLVAFLLLVIANLVASQGLSSLRFDVTEEQLYTLSQSTETVLSKMDEDITIRLFYNEEVGRTIPIIDQYAQRVKLMLRRYASLSGDKVSVTIINPEAFSKEEDQALSFGVKPIPIDGAGTQLYFGLIVQNSVDRDKEFPLLDPSRESWLEYDLTRAIDELSRVKNDSVAVFSSVSLSNAGYGQPSQWGLIDQLSDRTDVSLLSADKDVVPEDIAHVVLLHVKTWSDAWLRSFDRFIQRGGTATIIVDPYAIHDQGKASGLPEVFATRWGISTSSEVVADSQYALRVRNPVAANGPSIVSQLSWLAMSDQALVDDITTNQLKILHILAGGAIQINDAFPESLSYQSLAETTENSALYAPNDTLDPRALIEIFNADDQRYSLITRVSGQFPPLFEDNLVDNAEGTNSKGAIVLIGDSDFINDVSWVQKNNFLGQEIRDVIADNGSFFLNVIDSLLGSHDLISLRSRRAQSREFTVIEDIRKKAEQQYLHRKSELETLLQVAEEKLQTIYQNDQGDEFSAAIQQETVETVRQEVLKTRQELREVQHQLKSDIENIGAIFKVFHIFIVPFSLLLLGLLLVHRLRQYGRLFGRSQ